LRHSDVVLLHFLDLTAIYAGLIDFFPHGNCRLTADPLL